MTVRGYDPEKAEYNPANNSERTLLEERIPKYNKTLWTEMIQECKLILERVEMLSFKTESKKRNDSTQIRSFTIENAYGEPAYFTIKFSMPIIHYIHSAFKYLHFQFGYTEKSDVEYTPCYLMNLNHVALSKIEKTRGSDSIYGSIGDGLYSKFTHQGGKYMMFSSSNILLLGATKENIQISEQESINKCFEYCYWYLPAPKKMNDVSCIHNLIYHKSSNVERGGVLQLRKTILKILKIKGRSFLKILPRGKTVKCFSADVALLVYDGKKIFSEKQTIFLIDHIVNSFKEGDILNALIIVQNISHPRYSLVVGSVGDPIDIGDIKSLLSIVMWKELQYLEENSSISHVGKLNILVNNILEILQKNMNESDIFYPSFAWNNNINKKIEKSIDELFPLYIIDDDDVHQLSPTIMSFLLTYDPKILRNTKYILTIIKMLNLITPNSKKWGEPARSQLQISNNKSNPLTSTTINLLLENFPLLINMMIYSRIFHQHHAHQG